LKSSEKDPIFNKTGMKLNTKTLICGPAGSGKTTILSSYLMLSNDTFNKIYVRAESNEPFYDMLVDQLKDQIEVHRSFSTFPEVFELKQEKAPRYLMIFYDNCINDMDKTSRKKLSDYFCYGRVKNCTMIFFHKGTLGRIYFSENK
jgi:predicted ATP-binding protein involved in virulence